MRIQRRRHPFATADLLPRYTTALIVAGLAAPAGALGSARFFGSDNLQRGVPALLVGEVLALAVLAVATFLIARKADRQTLERMCRHILWAIFVVAAVPSLIWLTLWLSAGEVKSLLGLAALVVGALPLLAAYRRRAALPIVLVCCLLVSIAMLALWQRLFLLLPVSVAATGGWALALSLLGYAARRSAKNVVPSN
jgi:hypothetical protein